MDCSRTACGESIDGRGHYTIFNNGSVEGRKYCVKCGRGIVEYSHKHDDVKIEYQAVDKDGNVVRSYVRPPVG